jgi:tetrapyrrole methylase family protein/MazG family protein
MKQYYIQGENTEEAMTRLIDILSYLRSEEGCSWDRAQTHESLKFCLIEEAYEVIEAIQQQDWANLEEELGDLLLQVLFHGQIGAEKGTFDMASIANKEADKMLRRHPHVFLNNNGEGIDKAVEKWENMKRKEKNNSSHSESMKSIPKDLPALMKSYKIQKKAAVAGFDWDDVLGAFDKIREETQELLEVYQGDDRARIKDEVGDLLFAVVNVARFLKIDPEEALNASSNKFIHRFDHIEESAIRSGRSLDTMTLAEMDILWEQAKAELEGRNPVQGG